MDSEDEIAEIEEEMGGISTLFKLPKTIYNKKMKVRYGSEPINERFSSTIGDINHLLNEKFQTEEGLRLIRNNNVRVRAAVKRIEQLVRTQSSLTASISNHRHNHNMTEQQKIQEINMSREAALQLRQQKNNLRNLRRTSRILSRNSFTLGFWD